MEILGIWLFLAFLVGVGAGSRGRNGFGWFLLAVVISPLLAGLALIAAGSRRPDVPAEVPTALRDRAPRSGLFTTHTRVERTKKSTPIFAAEGVYGGLPYRVVDGGVVEAMMPGGLVQFKDMDQFLAAANAGRPQN